jgi:hypothetical protein
VKEKRYPTRGTFGGCCAERLSGAAARLIAAPVISARRSMDVVMRVRPK